MARLEWMQTHTAMQIAFGGGEGSGVLETLRLRGGGTYRIYRNSQGSSVRYRAPNTRGYWEIGTAATEEEAVALAQAHNDKRLVEAA
jgi:hypothetical protein